MKLAKIIQPQGDKILVMPILEKDKTDSGIITKVNKGSGKKPQMGNVLAVSKYLNCIWMEAVGKTKAKDIPLSFIMPECKLHIDEGDTIVFAEYAGDDIEILDLDTNELVKLKLLPAENVLAVVKNPEL